MFSTQSDKEAAKPTTFFAVASVEEVFTSESLFPESTVPVATKVDVFILPSRSETLPSIFEILPFILLNSPSCFLICFSKAPALTSIHHLNYRNRQVNSINNTFLIFF